MADLATAIETAAATIVTTLANSRATVVRRVRPSAVKGDALPLVCVTAVLDQHTRADFEGDRFGEYTLAITVVEAHTTLAPSATARQLRQDILRGLGEDAADWSAVPQVRSVSPDGRQLIDAGQLDRNYHYSPLAFTVRTQEDW